MKKMRSCLIAVVCVIATLIGSSPLMSEEKQQAIDEAQFVEEFLKMKFHDAVSNSIPLVINQTLAMWESHTPKAEFATSLIEQAKRENDPRLIEAVKDFCEKNAAANTFESIGTVKVSHILLSDNDVKLFRKSGWGEFYKKYPESPGIIALSRTGFNKDGTLAVIYMGNQRGWLFGSGHIHTFDKKDGKWIEVMIPIGPRWRS